MQTGKTVLKYMAVLIALYLGVEYASGLSSDVKTGATGTEGIISTLQGRSG
jgi:hypothetical protein